MQCHLCGDWFRAVGGSHLRAHGWTLLEYRVAFHLSTKTPTVSAGTSQLMSAHTSRRVAAGELPPPPQPPEAARRRWVAPGRSLAALRPDLVRELHPTRNGDLDPFMLARYSAQKLWWSCPRCAHEWRSSPQSRVGGGYGCPRCAAVRRGDARRGASSPERSLAALHPGLVRELRDLDPVTLGPGSSTRAWWRCSDCGHEWSATIKKRTGGSGCPHCAQARLGLLRRRVPRERSLAARFPELAQQLHAARNGELDPWSLGISTRQTIWWQCPDCRHEWIARVRDRAAGSACPRCARQPAHRQEAAGSRHDAGSLDP